MKISLAWVFDYIDYPLSKINVDKVVHLFNTRTAEIEHYQKVEFDLKGMFLARVKKTSAKEVVAYSAELGKEVKLSPRSDAVVGKCYLVKGKRWAQLSDFGLDKDGLFSALVVTDKQEKGDWKKDFTSIDYILDVDNKSINHRPDLWGHYGIAREIAAFLNLKLKPLSKVLTHQKVVDFGKKSKKGKGHSFEIVIDTAACSRFAGLYAGKIKHKDSEPWMAARLIKVGARSINTVVDLTNYVMFDIGHPMHVFDADKFDKKQVIVRNAKKSEKLMVLGEQDLKLRSEDIVVADHNQAVSLAGIKGGQASGFSDETKEIFLESAGFDATVIRKTAQHFKLRTEASCRFEKSLDPMQNINVIQRFVYLAKKAGVLSSGAESIVSVGKVYTEQQCTITHAFIEQRIGMSVKQSFVQDTLTKLGFKVALKKLKSGIVYSVTVPTFRVKKDIEIQEDILEEIVRMYGFENIEYQLPVRQMSAFDTQAARRTADIKKFLAFSCNMHEVRDYLFYDESFISRLGYSPSKIISVKNSVSQNWTTLVDSLVPHLLKNVELNAVDRSTIRLFEWNSIWSKADKKLERKSLAGIVFDKKSVDFYAVKQELQGLWDLLGVQVEFQKPKKSLSAWYDQYKTAELFVGKQRIGLIGMINQEFMGSVLTGQGCLFELDADFLITVPDKSTEFEQWSKYQDVTYDISMLVPLKVSADELKAAILKADKHIQSVDLVDYFEKEDWLDKRSVTFRYQMSSMKKTLDKDDMDAIAQSVQKAVKKYHVEVR